MSLPNSTKKTGGAYRKPRADLYTLLLVIALLAIITAIVFLCLHMQIYDWQFKGGPTVMNVVRNAARVVCRL